VAPVSSPSRLRSLRPYLLAIAIPSALAPLVLSRELAVLLIAMWVVLLGTAGLAATSQGPQRTSAWNPRGRLLGDRPFDEPAGGDRRPEPPRPDDARGR
jgi:hypothetical protein